MIDGFVVPSVTLYATGGLGPLGAPAPLGEKNIYVVICKSIHAVGYDVFVINTECLATNNLHFHCFENTNWIHFFILKNSIVL